MTWSSFSVRSVLLFLVLVTSRAAFGYGPVGHQIIGAIADQKLAGTPVAEKISSLLDGLTLEGVSTYPDEIRGWDKNGPDDPSTFHFSRHPKIDAQLRDFWHANPPTKDPNSATPSHHWFHYTDVPVTEQKYGDGQAGRSKWDVVHMIPYCIAVLKGEIPEDNPRKITKPIAVILLTHFTGDIHQPLHVGAEFFDKEGHVANPDKSKDLLEDQGGNTLTLNLTNGGPEQARHAKFHYFWDSETVAANLPPMPDGLSKEEKREKIDAAKKDLVQQFVAHEPKDWKLPATVALKDYAEAWANDIMPIAREAHDRLQFREVVAKQMDDGSVAPAGFLDEKKMPDGISYYDWSAGVAREEMAKAGWRLADVLQQALR